MYAIIRSGGKQYKVEPGTVVKVEKLDAEVGSEVTFEALMASDGKTVQIGDPVLAELVVKGKVLAQDKAKKVIVFKYKPKKDYRKKQGHRQPYTMVKIESLGGDAPKAAAPAAEVKAEAEEAKAEKKISSSMKKDELIAYAKEHGIEIDEKATKAVIIETIESALK